MLTQKQLNLLNLIHERVQKDGVSPSFDEMKEAVGLKSKSGIHRLISALEERGFIRRLAHRARAIEILRMPDGSKVSGFSPTVIEGGKTDELKPSDTSIIAAIELPVMGRIAAGTPIEAIQEVSHEVAIPTTMISSNKTNYALEVKGDSMIEAGINDGDIVIIQEQNTANNGDIVVALIDDEEATLKYLRREGQSIALKPANQLYETRIFRPDQVKIQGKLVGLVRTYH